MIADLLSTTALTVAQTGTGVFFAFSGWHKLTNPARHAALVETLKECGVPFLPFMQYWVPGWELAGGLMVLSGLWPLQIVGALALITICAIACATDGRKRVNGYQPIDLADRIDDWLYLPEILYILLLSIILSEAVASSGLL